jgi:TIR domain-containing protein
MAENSGTPTRTCIVLYKWGTEAHQRWMRQLAAQFLRCGIDAYLDQFENVGGSNLGRYTSRIASVDRVILICTPEYAKSFDAQRGVAGYEANIITGELISGTAREGKYIPVLRSGTPETSIPAALRSLVWIDFRDDDPEKYASSLQELLRAILERPRFKKPELGPLVDLPAEEEDYLLVPWPGQPRQPATPAPLTPQTPGVWSRLMPDIYFQGFDFVDASVEHARRIMGDFWTLGQDGPWYGEVVDGVYRLINPAARENVKRFNLWLKHRRYKLGQAPVSVDVRVYDRHDAPTTPSSAAGLIYRFDRATQDYYAFTVGFQGTYSVLRRDSQGLRTRGIQRHDAIRPGADAFNTIAVWGEGASLHLFINGQLVRTLDVEAGDGDVGLVAVSTGVFEFDNLSICSPVSLSGALPADETPMTRGELLTRLSQLLPAQFEAVLFRARIPPQYLPPSTASQVTRAIDALRYMEQQNQLDQLSRIIHQVVTEH